MTNLPVENAPLGTLAYALGVDSSGFIRQQAVVPSRSVFLNMTPALQARISAGTATDSDGTAVSAAINATLLSGSLAQFPPGYYPINGRLIAQNDNVLEALGKATLKPINGSTSNPVLIECANKSNVTFIGFSFDGNRPNLAGFNNFVTVFQSTNVVFDRCYWTNTRGIAVIFSGCFESGVRYSRFYDVGTLNRTTGNNSDRKQAIAFSSGGGRNFADFNYFQDVGLDCISFASNGIGNRVIGNTIRINEAGSIYVASETGIRVIGNSVTNGPVGGNGIDVINTKDITIVGNVCIGNGAAGILLAGSITAATVAGNVCKNNFSGGISLHRGGITFDLLPGQVITNVTLSNNECYDDQGTGLVTQRYAIGVYNTGGTFSNLKIDNNNQLTGYDGSGNVSITDTFQGNDIQAMGFPRFVNINAGSTFTLAPNSVYGEVSVSQLNNSYPAAFSLRNGVGTVELYDPSSRWVNTDTGTDQAVYMDAGDSTFKLKNRTAGTLLYMIRRNF